MKEKLTNNLYLKIVAVLFSVALWIISININDPLQSKTFPVTVQLQNMAAMTAAGKYVEILDNSDDISVTVRANRSVMDSFSSSNIVATADLREVDANNQVPIRLTTTRVSGNRVESVRSESEYVYLKVEDIRQTQKRIEVNIENEPADGYILGRASTEQTALSISGPESLVDEVSRVAVTVDLAGATDDVSMLLPVEMYDANGERIIDSRLTTSISQVQCVATILETRVVPLNYIINGEPEAGYGWTGQIERNPDSVVIAGKSTVVRNISSIEISDAIDITNARTDVTVMVDLKEYLPEGVSFAEPSFNGRVMVTAFIEPQQTRTVEIDSSRIQLINVPEGMEGTIQEMEDTLSVTFVGLESVMAQLNAEELQGYLDLQLYMEEEEIESLEEGSYMVGLTFNAPQGIEPEEKVELEVEITSAE